jgi:hypothetical protein
MQLNDKTLLMFFVGVVVGLIGVTLYFQSTIVVFPPSAPPVSAPPAANLRGGELNVPPHDVANLIRVSVPAPGAVIESPLTVIGEARGIWYFEASFPIELHDAEGNVLKTIVAQAQDEWMTENFVPFTATLTFPSQPPGEGTLVFRKDNPSGFPEHDAELRIPVRFPPPSATGEGDGATMPSCKRTGCSNQICADADVITTCEYRPEYACYEKARCERQANGECGWTLTKTLEQCLANIPLER